MSEHPPDDNTESKLGKTNLVSGPTAIPSAGHSTASYGQPSDVTKQPASYPLPQSIGRFEVRACLGGGAFGWVYRAFDPTLRRDVAIKLPRAERLQTPTDRARFLNEARAAATIRHPHVVPVHEVGEMDGVPFIVMAYVPGPTLAGVIDERTVPFPTHEAAQIVRSLAIAVQAAHDKGVVHRDLKPANVLFDPEHNEYVVTDFGLARVVDPSDPRVSTTGVAGTPSYMSPEQARGDSAAVGSRSDVYSLGVILFELLTGRLPFTGGSVAEVISKVLMTPPPAASTLRENIPAGLDAVCSTAMAKLPEDRYMSAQDFAAALLRFTTPDVHSEPTQTVVMNSPLTTVPHRRSYWWFAIPAFMLVITIVAIAFFSRNNGKDDTAKSDAAAKTPTPPLTTPIATPPGDVSKPKSKSDQTAERRAAEWALRNGGVIDVIDTEFSEKSTLTKVDQIPNKFEIIRIEMPRTYIVSDQAVFTNLTGLRGIKAIDFFSAHQITNAGFEHLAKLPGLTYLGLRYCTKVNDAGIAALKKHPTLREVYLTRTGMTAKGIASIATIPNLENLNFSGHAITDDWLEAVSSAREIRQLYVSYSNQIPGANITAAGLAHLAKLNQMYLLDLDSAAIAPGAVLKMPEMPALTQLFLRRTTTTDDDLPVLLKYPNITTLALHDTAVTDKGMATVAKLALLRWLIIEGTKIGDDGLLELTSCKKLQYVGVGGTKVTPRGIETFQTVMPECKVNAVAPKE